METTATVKVKDLRGGGGSFAKYRALTYGDVSLGYCVKAELLFSTLGPMPGAAGLFLRSRLYRGLFGRAGRGLLVGRNVTFRHPRKINIGDGVIIDDNCVLDAKGDTNAGIRIGDEVFLGRNTIVYCKNGDISLERRVNVSANCTIFSSNSLTIGEGTVVGGYSYLLSGGEYDYTDMKIPFADQSGMGTRGPLVIGANCWLGARVTVLDGAGIGEHCVIGAGAVVTKPIPAHTLAVGVPARSAREIKGS